MRRAFFLVPAFLALSACQTITPPPSGLLRVQGDLDDAAVWVDDVYGGRAVDWRTGRPVRVGFHRVEIRRADHHSHLAEVTVPKGGLVVVTAVLRPHLD